MTQTNGTGKSAPGANLPQKQDQSLATHKAWDEISNELMTYFQERQSVGLVLPPDYSPSNAILAAKLHLLEMKEKDSDELAINLCTRASVVNAISKMLVQGLNVYKKQVAFIRYKDKLTCQNEYFGNLAIAKRDGGVKDVRGHCVYENDIFEYMVDTKTGRKQLIKHEQKFENRNNEKIIGAFAIVCYDDGTTNLEVMNMAEIRASWAMGFGGGNTKAHRNFTDQMCIKTVCNRAVKLDMNTSDDSAILPDNEDVHTSERDHKISTGVKSTKKVGPGSDIDFEEVRTGTTGTGSSAAITTSEATEKGPGSADPITDEQPSY